jgi:hypothetical protein
MGAGLAAFDMAAQRRRSAALDRRHHLQLAEAHVAGMGRTPSRPVMAEDIRHLVVTTAARQPGIFSRRSSGLVTSPSALMATRV